MFFILSSCIFLCPPPSISRSTCYNLTIIDFQRMWESAVREAVRVCEILGRLYKVFSGSTIDQEKDITISWGNGVLYDEDKTNSEMMSQVQAGLLAPERYLGWYYNLPCDTEADREKIRKEYMPEVKEVEE